jgi:hypothetical protein
VKPGPSRNQWDGGGSGLRALLSMMSYPVSARINHFIEHRWTDGLQRQVLQTEKRRHCIILSDLLRSYIS